MVSGWRFPSTKSEWSYMSGITVCIAFLLGFSCRHRIIPVLKKLQTSRDIQYEPCQVGSLIAFPDSTLTTIHRQTYCNRSLLKKVAVSAKRFAEWCLTTVKLQLTLQQQLNNNTCLNLWLAFLVCMEGEFVIFCWQARNINVVQSFNC